MDSKTSSASGPARGAGFGVMLLLLLVVISLLMHDSFVPGQTLFSSDGPLGRLTAQCHQLPAAFTGVWEDLYSIGYREQGAMPNITYALRWALSPVIFSKFYAPISLVILGLGAWCFFREAGLSWPGCVLGGLAAALNSEFFSTACWGVAAHPLAVGMSFFALAAVMNTSSARGWVRLALAGCAVGMGVAEGADVGAILSMYVAAFVMFQAWVAEGPKVKNLAGGAGRVTVIVVFALFLAAQSISSLVNTQIEGVVGMHQDERTREERWDWATEWSLPKRETLSLIVPGLFGYRLDTPGGGNYWGHIGQNPALARYYANGQQGEKPRGLPRQTGSGIYAGVTVALIALWAVMKSFREGDGVFSPRNRRLIWFWLGAGVISLLLGFGRFAPFYQLIYKLPYFSTIRNPVKFVTLVNFALVILFAFGVDGLWRKYLLPAKGAPPRAASTVRFDNRWIWGCVMTLVLSLVAWGVYASSRPALEEYMRGEGIIEPIPHTASAFSIAQVGWFVFFFVLAAGLLALVLRGRFAGAQAKWAVVLLGVVLVADLGRANQPWIIYWDYPNKYATNPVIEMLRQKPYEHRIAQLPYVPPPALSLMGDLYHFEWEQHQIPYFNIQSLDIVQLARFPEDLAAFYKATSFDTSTNASGLIRRWELTNTRYILGPAELIEMFNRQFDPLLHRLQIAARFNIIPRRNSTSIHRLERVTAEFAPDGKYAVFEFTGALPRAKLYPQWKVNTNDESTLDTIVAPTFDPAQTVIVAGNVPPPAANPDTNHNSGTVEITSYAPKDIVLKADAAAPSVLLLNDRFEPNWKVAVDGKPATLLRCNFIMRGVYLEPGAHTVEFRFQPGVKALYVSLAGVSVGLALVGVILVPERRKIIPERTPVASPRPQTPSPAPAPVAAKAVPNKEKRRSAKSKR